MLPLVTGSYIIHVPLHDAFTFGATQVFISTVLCCIICSMLNCFFINGTYLTQNSLPQQWKARAWSYWLPWQLGVWLTHSLTLICTCKERFHIIMKCVTYNHPKLPGQWLLTRHIHKGMWICCQNATWKGIIKKSSQFSFIWTFLSTEQIIQHV